MVGFFMFIANATLTAFIQSATPSSFDPVTGNPIFTTTQKTLVASLEEVSNPNVPLAPGVEETAIYLEGRAINPPQIPTEFMPNTKYKILINFHDVATEGEFYLLPTVKSRLGLESAFNSAIEGWLVV